MDGAIEFSGFTDEATSDLDGQIRVTQELGWKYLSARTIGEGNIHNISNYHFDEVCEKLKKENVTVAEFGTLIGNWSKKINSDWQTTLDEIERCIPRMKKLGVRYARVMSYAQEPWGMDQNEQERFRRLREIVSRFKDAGLEALHENCMNWGGFSADHTLRLLDEVPDLRLIFDTANPVFQRDRSKSRPYPWQNSFEFYNKVKHAIAHVHVKDAIMRNEEGEPQYTLPGEGDAQLEHILKDLKKSNYQGFITIEPHMGKVFHLDQKPIDEQSTYDIYLEYAKRFEALVEKV